jgi:hypothetical protein
VKFNGESELRTLGRACVDGVPAKSKETQERRDWTFCVQQCQQFNWDFSRQQAKESLPVTPRECAQVEFWSNAEQSTYRRTELEGAPEL